ncbi:Uncharacterised protein [Mycobacteroides abscessus subsp. abscessus]|nr:Uncharacterised protein [Mycobacteroides abscessus subsp. abscessus]
MKSNTADTGSGFPCSRAISRIAACVRCCAKCSMAATTRSSFDWK